VYCVFSRPVNIGYEKVVSNYGTLITHDAYVTIGAASVLPVMKLLYHTIVVLSCDVTDMILTHSCPLCDQINCLMSAFIVDILVIL